MPDLSPGARRALTYWGVIEYAAREGLTTADLWANLQDAAEELGLSSPGVSARDVSELRGLASSIQRSERQFARAGDDQGLDARIMGEAPWSRPLAEQAALGVLQVRFQHTFMTPDGPQTEWRTSMFTGPNIPGTVGELRAAIAEDAQQMADKYGVSHIEFGSVQVLTV